MEIDELLDGAPDTSEDWAELLDQAMVERSPELLELAARAIQDQPWSYRILYLAALAALVEERPAGR